MRYSRLPAFLLAKIWNDLAANIHQAEDIRLKLPFDLFGCGRFERADNTVTRVVHDGIDASKFFKRFGDRRFDRIDVGDIQPKAFDVDDILQIVDSSGRRIVAATFQFFA